MSTRQPLHALVLALTLALAAAALAHDPAQHGFSLVTFEPRASAPSFTAEALDGGTLGLGELRGRHVLLNFWATWCPPCLEEMPSMDALYRELGDRGLVVVAIASDREGAAVVRPFIDRLGVSFPILLDPDGRVAQSYGARNLPVTFIIDPEGKVMAAAQGARDWASPEARSVMSELLPAP